jgi:hypothetical protein
VNIAAAANLADAALMRSIGIDGDQGMQATRAYEAARPVLTGADPLDGRLRRLP